MMKTNNTVLSNGVNRRKSSALSALPGRPSVVNQAEVGRHPTTGIERLATQQMNFTREGNVNVMKCYYQSKPAKRGYMARIAALWKKRGGFEMTE